jgi:uncharacterized protein YjbI with pentapeptide repeats
MTIEELLQQGNSLILDPANPPETRLIRAELIVQALNQGRRIAIENAIIAGDFNLRNTTVSQELSLTSCELQSRFDAAYTIVKAPFSLVNCVCVGEVNLDSTEFQLDVTIDGSIFKENVIFSDAKIHGVFSCLGITVEKEIDFIRTLFQKNVALRNSRFDGKFDFSATCTKGSADFSGVIFKSPATFDSAKVSLGLNFVEDGEKRSNPAKFESAARFAGAEVTTFFEISGVKFSKDVSFNRVTVRGSFFMHYSHFVGDADFTVVQIDGALSCDSVVFEGRATFPGAKIGIFANFSGSVFKAKADFRACRVSGNVLFRENKGTPAAEFEKAASFRGIQVGGDAEFQGAKFLNTLSLVQAKIDGDCVFRGMTVSDEARLMRMRIGGQGDFQGTTFSGGLNFTGSQVDGPVSFSEVQRWQIPAATIENKASFISCTFKQSAYFQGTKFNGDSDFHLASFSAEANYVGAVFVGPANFENARFQGFSNFGADSSKTGPVFKSDVSFKHAHFDSDTRFDSATFEGRLILSNAHFGTLFLGEPNGKTPKLCNDIDLSGCDYKAIYCDHENLLFKSDGNPRVVPYQRQIYVQLEQTLRKTGEDRAADFVYLARRKSERSQYWAEGRIHSWVSSVVYGVLARYGVHPYRLLVASVVLVVLGTMFYSFADTVIPPEKGPLADRKPPTVLSLPEAFAVSLHSFLPINVSAGSQWQPSPIPRTFTLKQNGCKFVVRPATICTWLLQIPGWILVPLGVAAITGALRRTSAA